MTKLLEVRISDASLVGEARRGATRIAREAGLSATRAGEAAIIATELANNLHRYGGRDGTIVIQSLDTPRGGAMEILAIDTGPGMADVDRCLRDGFSTGGTPGTGLGAVKRMSGEFDVYSMPGQGTVVMSRVFAEGARAAGPPYALEWGSIARPVKGEEISGDTFRVVEQPNLAAIVMADGLGHGPGAADAAGAVADAFMEDPFLPPERIVARGHQRASGTRGAAVAVAQLNFATRVVQYCGVGNIAGSLQTAHDSRSLFTHNGTVGVAATKVREVQHPLPANGLLIMHSDGLQSRWRLSKYPGLHARHPAIVAAVLARDFTRGRDDVTVLAIRIRA